MTDRQIYAIPLISTIMLAMLLGACSLSERRDAGGAVQNGVIVDDLRRPSRQNY